MIIYGPPVMMRISHIAIMVFDMIQLMRTEAFAMNTRCLLRLIIFISG
jgi:hypothetical protein